MALILFCQKNKQQKALIRRHDTFSSCIPIAFQGVGTQHLLQLYSVICIHNIYNTVALQRHLHSQAQVGTQYLLYLYSVICIHKHRWAHSIYYRFIATSAFTSIGGHIISIIDLQRHLHSQVQVGTQYLLQLYSVICIHKHRWAHNIYYILIASSVFKRLGRHTISIIS